MTFEIVVYFILFLQIAHLQCLAIQIKATLDALPNRRSPAECYIDLLNNHYETLEAQINALRDEIKGTTIQDMLKSIDEAAKERIDKLEQIAGNVDRFNCVVNQCKGAVQSIELIRVRLDKISEKIDEIGKHDCQ